MKNMRQRFINIRPVWAGLFVAGLLGGCASSPTVHYYSLQSPAQAQTPSTAAAPFMIEVLPVTIPVQADHPQLMLRGADGAIFAMYSERWTAPLSDEIQAALSVALTRDLGALDVQAIRAPADAPLWRIQVDVQRFDAADAGDIVVDATWRVRPLNLKGDTFLCRSIVRVPAAEAGVPAVISAQQRAVTLLSGTIASVIKSGGRAAQASDDQVQLLGCNPSKG